MSRASGTLYMGNLPGDIREREVEDLFCNGHKIENSVNEVAELVSGTETAGCLVLNEDKFPVSSVNESVPETNKIIEQKDDSEISLELQQSSSLTPLADSGIVQRPVKSDDNVIDIAGEHETEHRASPSMENVEDNTNEIIKPGNMDADNVTVECVEDALDLSAEHVPSCSTGNDASTTEEVTTIAAGDSRSCTSDKVITSLEFEHETPCPQSSENTDDSLTLGDDSSIVQRPVGSDENVNTHEINKSETGDADNDAVECVEDAPDITTERGTEPVPSCLPGNDASTAEEVIEQELETGNVLDIAREHETEYKASPSMENVAAYTDEIGNADNDAVECVEDALDLTTERGTEPLPSSLPGNDASTAKEVIEQELETGNDLDIAREQETEYEASPSMENVAANSHEIIKSETGDADNDSVECVDDALGFTTECGTEPAPSFWPGNDASTTKEVIEQEGATGNVLDIATEHETEYKASPSMENVAANTHETGDADNDAVERVEDALDLATERGTEPVLSCLSGNDASTDNEVIEQERETGNVLDIAREHETEYKASPSMENVEANTHETGNANNDAVGCVEDAPDLTTERGTEPVLSCLSGNDACTDNEVIEPERETGNVPDIAREHESEYKASPSTEDVAANTHETGDADNDAVEHVEDALDLTTESGTEAVRSCLSGNDASTDNEVIEQERETGNVLDIAKEHETEYKASPSMENVAPNTNQIIKSETGDADNDAIERVEDALDLTTERGTEPVRSCLSGRTSNHNEVIEQERDTGNVLDIAREHETEYKASPSMENVAANTNQIIKPESGGADNGAFECVEGALDLSTERGTGTVPSCLPGKDASTAKDEQESERGNVLDIAREHETEYKVSPSMVAVECVEDALDLTTDRGSEPVRSCLPGNDASTDEVIEQETEVNIEGDISSKLNPVTEDAVAGGDSTSGSNDNVITSMESNLETPDPQSSEGTDSLILVADSSIAQMPVEGDKNVNDIAREHEAESKASPSMENAATNAHEITTGDADNVAVECDEDALVLTKEHGTEHLPSSLTGNDASTAKEFIEKETEDAVTSPISCSKLKPVTEDVNDIAIAGGDNTSCLIDKVITRMEFDPETPGAQDFSTLHGVDDHLKPETSVVDGVCFDAQSVPCGTEKELDVGSCSVIKGRDMRCHDVSSGNDVSDSSVTKDKLPNCVADNVDMESKGEHLAGAHVNSDDIIICQETKDVENSLENGKSMSLPENSRADIVKVVEPLTRPFHFLIRIPRFDDFKIKEQIRKAQLLVEEKTQHRDAFKIDVQKYKSNCLGYAAEYEAAMSESRTLKKSVRDKRSEIDSLQSVMNKVKNALSVDDIDTRIHGMEHMIEHETLPLKEEKLLIREIKQLKQLREQLSSNIGSHDELQQALNNREQIEESLKVLKKELEILKDSVLKADAVARALERKYEDENRKVKEVQTRYVAANNIRQDAYAHLQSLRRQLFEKNQQFRMYKDSAAAASDYAAKRDREALHHLCVNQVESIMELWNQNNEFRKEYVRCNMKSTLRRLGTMDGRSLAPDEHPHVFTSYGDERVDRLVSNPVNSVPMLQPQNLEKDVVEPLHGVTVGDKLKVKESEEKIPATRPRKEEKHIVRNDLATASGREITEDDTREKQHIPAKEEFDQAGKVEELIKEEAEAKLKEQRRLEEKAKALEALERKKRNAEKAQMRAELRAQKEAEQKEKEREKRWRKKERRKGSATEVPDGNNPVETTPNCESWMETVKEPEIKENPVAVSKRPQKISQFTKQSKAKSIPPPPLRNRGRRKIQQWMWVILTCVLVVALFLLGNVGFFSNLSNLRRRNSGF